ncbi:hypothetical protein DPV78_006435 [Talaromyces pinophilus]|nr:hypothetical protein DPV78_006435 [Talaromyces pinophilus]
MSVPPGGRILLTGANGYLASVTISLFLERGCSVRGTVRSVAAHAWMKTYFGERFELVEVPNIYAPDAWGTPGLLDGVHGIAHMAMDTSMDPGNHAIIDDTVNSTLALLEAASKVASVKSVVITSSLAACALPTTGVPYTIDAGTWNTDAIQQTSTPAVPDELNEDKIKARWRGIELYAAFKALSEQASFAWVREHAPVPFGFNTVVPNVNFGIAISPPNMGYRSTAAVLDAVVKGYAAAPSILPPQWYVDVEDTALLHLAALTLPEVQGERLLAFAGQYSWTQILEILHRRFPGRIRLKALPTDGQEVVDKGEVDNRWSIEVLKIMGKKEGFASLEDTLAKAMETIFENQGRNVPKTRIDLYYESLARSIGS